MSRDDVWTHRAACGGTCDGAALPGGSLAARLSWPRSAVIAGMTAFMLAAGERPVEPGGAGGRGANAPSAASSASTSSQTATRTPAAAAAPGEDAPKIRWQSRLARLDPSRPIEYLELAEEVADGAAPGPASDAARELARELFGFAGALDPAQLGRSAMLGIASLAETDDARARARLAAELVGGRGVASSARRIDRASLEALARAFSYYRRGNGVKALAALRQSGADQLLESISDGLPGGASAFRTECRAMRGPGRLPADPDLEARLLMLELALRRGDVRGLGLDILLNADRPLPEIDLGDAQALWGVDPTRAWWRNGAWAGAR